MAEPFKNLLNKRTIKTMSGHFHRQWPGFDAKGFVKSASKGLDKLELKERGDQVTAAMVEYFPADFPKAGDIMLGSLGACLDKKNSTDSVNTSGISGWAIIPMTLYVGRCGYKHFDVSMNLFREMTKRTTSEFGIREFLQKSPGKTLAVLMTWAGDENQHVRRLASEGCRPRLPWAQRLAKYIDNPAPVIKLLERLKDDDEEYVRRSVANNLNDIAKDHPDVVAEIAGRWLKGASEERKRLVRHACRTLIKNGHKKTLSVLGYKAPKVKQVKIKLASNKVVFGDALEFSLSFSSDLNREQPFVIDYIIHHQKANGTISPKVFKLKTTTLAKGKDLSITKRHAIKKITTRVYYPGLHRLEIVINGVSIGKKDFKLIK